MNWAVFLDRDGVLTDAPIVDGQAVAPASASELRLLPGAAEAVARLRLHGARVFVVTNQPDVARGTLELAELGLMHERIVEQLSIDEVVACPHDGDDDCSCRKPRPGMLLDLAARWDVDLARSWMVGDRWVDIAAGAAAGTTTVLIDRPYSWASTSVGSPPTGLVPDHRAADIAAAAEIIAPSPIGDAGVP